MTVIDRQIVIDCIVTSYNVEENDIIDFSDDTLSEIYSYISTFKTLTQKVNGERTYYSITVSNCYKVDDIVKDHGYRFFVTPANSSTVYTLWDKTFRVEDEDGVNRELAMVLVHLFDQGIPFSVENVSADYL